MAPLAPDEAAEWGQTVTARADEAGEDSDGMGMLKKMLALEVDVGA